MNQAAMRGQDRDVVDLVQHHPLAWVITADGAFSATPLPMLVECDETGKPVSLLGHFGRGNPQVERIRATARTLFLFSGPNGYISPEYISVTRDWAPTWNYSVARIVADVVFDEDLAHEALQSLVAWMERGRPRPWSTTEMGARYAQLKRGIIAFRATIVSIDARFKLGQDERPEVLADIVSSLAGTELGEWMARFNRRDD